MNFSRYIGVDYSGAGMATERQSGIRVLLAQAGGQPELELDAGGRNWSRVTLTSWLAERLKEPQPTLVGLDHCFSFPSSFLEQHHLKTWDAILDFADTRWATGLRKVADVVSWQEIAIVEGTV